jgi:hydroxyacylglutathione hydrolase
MFFRRFYDDQLAQASYLIGCQATGEALVVDPNRHLEPYLASAAAEQLRITCVTETHIHADFVSGARELAHRTGARLLLSDEGGEGWRYGYAAVAGAELLHDGDAFCVGRVEVRARHTPGHTPEHLVFLVTDGAVATAPMGLLSGDLLFVGDVGRPDLLERAAHVAGTMELGARQLFASLRGLSDLPDFLQVWPGHGAGSACGKALGAVPQTTLGYERRFNWAFGVQEEEAFVRAVLAGQPEPPRYFAEMKRINRDGPRLRPTGQAPPALDPAGLAAAVARGEPVVDTRPARAFLERALPGTINIPLNRSFATWSGSLLPYDRPVHLIVAERGGPSASESVRALEGIGLDRIGGIAGAEVIDAWAAAGHPVQRIAGIGLEQLAAPGSERPAAVVDVRARSEWAAGHLPGSINLPLAELEARLPEIPRDRPVVIHCQTGARAAIAASLLRARGVDEVRVYGGGFAEWSAAGQPVERGVA